MIVASLIALVILIILSWPFLQYGPADTSRNDLLETKQLLSTFLANHRTNVAPQQISR